MNNPGIYILTSPSGKQYVGRDVNLPSRVNRHMNVACPGCPHIHSAIQKHGGDAFSVEIIRYPGISEKALNAVERWKIKQLQTLAPKGYNLTEGGEGAGIPSEETRQKIREKTRRQVVDGTHNFLGDKNPVHQRVADGTHNFLDGEISRRTQRKRIADGIHHFIGDKNPNYKRVADGTHNFLDGEIQRRSNKKRLKEGTHHLLGNNHWKRKKRQKAEWCYIIAVSRFYYEIHDYTLKRRAEFLSKDIPDTSTAVQEYLF